MIGWAGIKATARRMVHQVFRRAALYAAPGSIDEPVECQVRWHSAGTRMGELIGSQGYAEVVVQEDRVIFDTTDIDFTPARGGVVTLVDEPKLRLQLDVKSDVDGPLIEAWTVVRK